MTAPVITGDYMTSRKAVISIRVTEEEKQRIELFASQKGVTVTSFARDIVTEYSPEILAAKTDAAVQAHDIALEKMTSDIRSLTDEICNISKEVKKDRIYSYCIVSAVVFLSSLLGGGLVYWFVNLLEL